MVQEQKQRKNKMLICGVKNSTVRRVRDSHW